MDRKIVSPACILLQAHKITCILLQALRAHKITCILLQAHKTISPVYYCLHISTLCGYNICRRLVCTPNVVSAPRYLHLCAHPSETWRSVVYISLMSHPFISLSCHIPAHSYISATVHVYVCICICVHACGMKSFFF